MEICMRTSLILANVYNDNVKFTWTINVKKKKKLIDNKSFIDEKEQCVYDCKLTAIETNTIKS